jgi:hypothetical protein
MFAQHIFRQYLKGFSHPGTDNTEDYVIIYQNENPHRKTEFPW